MEPTEIIELNPEDVRGALYLTPFADNTKVKICEYLLKAGYRLPYVEGFYLENFYFYDPNCRTAFLVIFGDIESAYVLANYGKPDYGKPNYGVIQTLTAHIINMPPSISGRFYTLNEIQVVQYYRNLYIQ